MATAVYPAAVVTDAELPDVGDGFNQATALTTTFSIAATTATVADTSNFQTAGFFFLSDGSNDPEVVFYTGKTATTFTGCTRAKLGTTAREWASGASVLCGPIGRLWDQIVEEVKAIEGELGIDPAGASATVVARLNALDSTVAGKAASSHTHTTGDITNLSSWTGSTAITTLGTIGTGTWQGTAVAATYVGSLPTSKITSGTFADARISASSVTQHQASLSITESQISDLGAYITGITGEPLSDLSDVTITTIASGEILKWNGSAWVNNTLAEAGISATGHTHTTSDITNLSSWTGSTAITTLGTIGTGTWQGTAIASTYVGSLPTSKITSGTFADARIAQTNVTQHQAALSITESQISDLQSYSLTSHNHTLDSLSNVTITTVASGEVLKWSGSAWINNTLAEAGIAAASHTHTTSDITNLSSWSGSSSITTVGTLSSGTVPATLLSGTVASARISGSYTGITGVGTISAGTWQGSAIASTYLSLGALSTHSDVTITSIASGEILKWNGSAWINNTLAEAGIAAASHTHTTSDITNLSSWAGSSSITTVGTLSSGTVPATLLSGTVASARISGSYTGITGVGTIAAGTWQGTAIANSYVADLPTSKITSGVLAHERGGLEADVSGYSGLIKISGGSTSQAVANTDYAAASHAPRHQSGGADAIKLDDLAAPDDNTDLDVSTSAHGLAPKAPDDTAKYLRGDGSWATAPIQEICSFNNIDASDTKYCAQLGVNPSTSPDNPSSIVGRACVVTGLRVRFASAPTAGDSYTMTFRKNGSDTSLVVTISGTDKTGYATDSISLAAGDYWEVKIVATSGTPANNTGSFVLEIKGA